MDWEKLGYFEDGGGKKEKYSYFFYLFYIKFCWLYRE